MAAKQTKAAKAAKPTSADARKIQVQAEAAKKVNYREGTARYEWFERIKAFNGKPLTAFLHDVQERPPSVPTKGKLAGKLEPPQGWIKFFTREGLIKTTE